MESFHIVDALECSICFEISASPIHTCTNGHVVCGICIDRIKKCPQCRANMAVNALAERMVRKKEFLVTCAYSLQGCPKSLKSTELKDHIITSCDYRPISCMVKGKYPCSETLQPQDVYQHLITKHGLTTITDSNSGNIERTSYRHTFANNTLPGIVGKLFDGKKFLSFKQVKDSAIYDWVAIIGDQAAADKYKIVIRPPKIPSKPTVSASKYAKFTWELPVVPISNCELSKVKERGHAAITHWTALIPYFKEKKKDEDNIVYKYSWCDNIEILKV